MAGHGFFVPRVFHSALQPLICKEKDGVEIFANSFPDSTKPHSMHRSCPLHDSFSHTHTHTCIIGHNGFIYNQHPDVLRKRTNPPLHSDPYVHFGNERHLTFSESIPGPFLRRPDRAFTCPF